MNNLDAGTHVAKGLTQARLERIVDTLHSRQLNPTEGSRVLWEAILAERESRAVQVAGDNYKLFGSDESATGQPPCRPSMSGSDINESKAEKE